MKDSLDTQNMTDTEFIEIYMKNSPALQIKWKAFKAGKKMQRELEEKQYQDYLKIMSY